MKAICRIALTTLALTACSEFQGASEAQQISPGKTVRLAPVALSPAARQFALTGTIRSAERATLAFQVSGNLASRPVELGDSVAVGDVIATLNNPESEPQVAAARARVDELRARLEQAERDERRVQRLFEQDAATEEELEQVSAQADALAASLENARAQLSRARRTLGETRITAPVAGTVEQVFFEPGEFVPAGRPVAAISGSEVMEVEIGVPENLLDEIEIGQPTELRLPLLDGRSLTGRVSEFARAALGPGELFPVVIALDGGQNLRSGLTVTWLLESSEPRRLTVPVAAVASPGGGGSPRVYKVVDGKARAVAVTLGAIVGERVVVEGELQTGDQVIVVGLNNLSDGRAVRVLE